MAVDSPVVVFESSEMVAVTVVESVLRDHGFTVHRVGQHSDVLMGMGYGTPLHRITVPSSEAAEAIALLKAFDEADARRPPELTVIPGGLAPSVPPSATADDAGGTGRLLLFALLAAALVAFILLR